MNKKTLKDEELLLLSRMGDAEAEQLLLERHFMRRFAHGRQARPDLLHRLTPLDYNGVFFKVYLNAVSTYRFGMTTFRGYLRRLLTHEIAKEIFGRMTLMDYGFQTLQLDTFVDESRSADTTFHDVIPDETPANDPRVFLNYADSLAKLSRLPPDIDQLTIDLVRLRLDGFTFEEAASHLGLTTHGARMRIQNYRRFAEFTLNHGGKKKKKL